MHQLIIELARDIDHERQVAATRWAIERQVATVSGRHRSAARRRLALGLAAVSRTSAGAVRRLDECLADDLVAGLAASR